MIINIATNGGRSHLLDIARELQNLGHTINFYSYISDKRAIKFGLNKKCNHSILLLALPFLFLSKFRLFRHWSYRIYARINDIFIAYYMKPCDIFIGHSATHCYSLKYAKKKWGAITILERGTSHIERYIKNMKDVPNFKGFLKLDIVRENKGYMNADYIVVGAEHVKNSFIEQGYNSQKIFVNNYGFNSKFFYPTSSTGEFDIIMVGTWGYRKGCDLIIKACESKGYKLLHVGNIGDLDFPTNIKAKSVGVKEEQALINYYKKAKVFVLPSREEGLALVQMQAICCGLPLVCSQYTGGRDIKKYCNNPEYIIEINSYDVDELCKCIDKALALAKTQKGLRNYVGSDLSEISFEGYGRRYNDFLLKIANNSKTKSNEIKS